MIRDEAAQPVNDSSKSVRSSFRKSSDSSPLVVNQTVHRLNRLSRCSRQQKQNHARIKLINKLIKGRNSVLPFLRFGLHEGSNAATVTVLTQSSLKNRHEASSTRWCAISYCKKGVHKETPFS
jgi:hypothetical protein